MYGKALSERDSRLAKVEKWEDSCHLFCYVTECVFRSPLNGS